MIFHNLPLCSCSLPAAIQGRRHVGMLCCRPLHPLGGFGGAWVGYGVMMDAGRGFAGGGVGVIVGDGGGVLVAAKALVEAKADGDGVVHLGHHVLVQMPHLLSQAAFVQGADLFQYNPTRLLSFCMTLADQRLNLRASKRLLLNKAS